MSTRDTVVGMIEIDVPDDQNLVSAVESLVESDTPDQAVYYRVRTQDVASETVSADLPQLNRSLQAELREFLARLDRSR